MVRQSERAWRNLVRAHGATLCYTPMIVSEELLRDVRAASDEEMRQAALLQHFDVDDSEGPGTSNPVVVQCRWGRLPPP